MHYNYHFNPYFCSPYQLVPYSHQYLLESSPPAPECSEEPKCFKKYHRTWTRTEIEKLYNYAREYSEQHNILESTLKIEDFSSFAAAFPQTPEQCLVKFKEILNSGTLKSGVWSCEEDQILRNHVEGGPLKWGEVAKLINHRVHGGVTVRTGKKCKERWNNHVNPKINRGDWTAAEELIMMESYKKYGNRWSIISRELGNRTENGVKNRIKSLLNKGKQSLTCQHAEDLTDLIVQGLKRE